MKLNKLFVITGLGAGGCIGVYYIFKKKFSSELLKSNICRQVLDEVGSHRGTLQFLGAPLEALKADFTKSKSVFNNESEVKMIVKGPKSGGIVFFITTETDGEPKKQTVNSIQLQIGMDDTKRLVIKKSPGDSETVTSSSTP